MDIAPSPALTVIVITYNHEDSIAKALDSILEQETTWSYEIWILEDCSTDRTLAIAEDYAKRHPGKFKIFAQPVNTKGRHYYQPLCDVNTRYFTILEGDDYWCDKSKIQLALGTLEANGEYVVFAHNTLVHDHVKKYKKTFRELHGVEIPQPMTLYNSMYTHTSSRVYRNVVDFRKIRFGATDFFGDYRIYCAFLDKGPLYYCDRVMSVYNVTGTGTWSSLSRREQNKATDVELCKVNSLMGHRHEDYFSGKVTSPWLLKALKKVFGGQDGWRLYLLLRHRETIYLTYLRNPMC